MSARKLFRALAFGLLALPAVVHAQPAGDFHQHVFSKETVGLIGPAAGLALLDAKDVVALLDTAGIRRAVLLSTAYMFGSPQRQVGNGYARVRLENDWTVAQAAQFPNRLVAFCGFNPLKDYALVELNRCASIPGLRRGIKLHLGNSDVQLDNRSHVERLRDVFAAANAKGMAIAVHLRASIRNKRPYGAKEARVFLEQVLPAAPDVVVQVAHLGGTGPGFDDPPAREVLAGAVEQGAPQTRNLWFDVASIADRGLTPDAAALMAQRIRQIGVERVLYGTDSAQGGKLRRARPGRCFTGYR